MLFLPLFFSALFLAALLAVGLGHLGRKRPFLVYCGLGLLLLLIGWGIVSSGDDAETPGMESR